jgi:hypothetical protein
MAQSIHFICEREGTGLKGLTLVERDTGLYRSCCWHLTGQEAESLVGGWIYLHPTKGKPSDFGGKITRFERIWDEGGAKRQDRVWFEFEAKPEGKVRNGAAKTTAWRIPAEPSLLTFPTS